MHSAEHILNQTMDRIFNCGRAIAAHVEKKKSKCDYRFNRPLTVEEILEIQERVNDIIAADMPISESFVDRDAAGKRFDLGRLPGDAGNRIRIVAVGDYDACPCIGPHVDSTGLIGSFRIMSTDFINGVVRIRFKLITPIEDSRTQS